MVQWTGWRALAIAGAAFVAALATVGCGAGSQEAKDEMSIALLMPNARAASYWEVAGFRRKVKEFCGKCTLLYGNAGGSTPRQRLQAERVLSDGADVLVVDPVEPGAASGVVRLANSAGVPVISYARPIHAQGVDYHVGVDSEGIGRLQGEMLRLKLQEERGLGGPVVVLTLGRDSPQTVGFRKEIGSNTAKVAGEYVVGDPDRETASYGMAKREMGRAIRALGASGFTAVVAADDEAAAGAIAAMRSAGIDPMERPTIGAGATLPAVKRVLSGEQHTSAYEANWQVRSAAVRAAVRLAKGHDVPAEWITGEVDDGDRRVRAILLEPTVVSNTNLTSTVIPYHFITPRELCVGAYAKDCAEVGIPTN